MDYSFIANILEKMIPAVPETLCITLIPFAVSLVLAVGITMAMYFEVPVLKDVCKVYVSFFRGTPLIGQLFLIYYGIPRLIPPLMAMSNVQAFIVTMSLHTASYVSEVLRGALLSVPKGQIEAEYADRHYKGIINSIYYRSNGHYSCSEGTSRNNISLL